MNHLLTHRGFILATDGDRRGYVDLPVVDQLYHHMETTFNFADDFGYVKDVLRAARQMLFDRNGRFILTKQLHVPCSNWVFNFSVSTLDYINGQPRRISLENFRDLLVFHPSDSVKVDARKVISDHKFGWMFDADPSTILSRWMAHEDGLTDLVMTLALIGGCLPKGWFHQTEARPPS